MVVVRVVVGVVVVANEAVRITVVETQGAAVEILLLEHTTNVWDTARSIPVILLF